MARDMPLGVQPTMQELTDAICSLANGKAVGPDGVYIELFKITLNGDLALRRRLVGIVIRIWKGEGAAALKICHHHGTPQKERSDRVRQLQGHLAGSARRQDAAGGIELLPTEPFYHRYDVRDSSAKGVGVVETTSVVFIDLTKAYDAVD